MYYLHRLAPVKLLERNSPESIIPVFVWGALGNIGRRLKGFWTEDLLRFLELPLDPRS
jgi:hypothetical protein